MTIDIKLRQDKHVDAFQEAKLLSMVVHGDTELSNTEFVERLLQSYQAVYDEEARKMEEIRTFTTGPDAREEDD